MPEGTDFNRPSSPEEGVVRYNTTQDALEFYNGTVWGVLNGDTIAISSVVYKIIVGASNDDDNGSNSGSVYVYDLDGSNEVKITASDGAADDQFGYSVAVGDSKIVVGVYGDDDNGSLSGSVYVYDLDGSNEVKITASDGATENYFGSSVVVGNSKIVVGAWGDTDNGTRSGSVYVYDLDSSNEVKITASDGAAYDCFGSSVAIGDNKIVVGAHGDTDNGSNSGSVYVYDLDGSNEVKITASDGAADDRFSQSVAVGDSKIVVGAYSHNNDNGAVYVYDLDGSNEVKITASDGASDDWFGLSVAVGNDKIVVGTVSGSFYVYDLDGSNEVKITASDGETGDRFGSRVAVIDSKIIVGAYGDDDNVSQSGSVYVYDLDGSNEVKITASDGASNDYFGLSIAAG